MKFRINVPLFKIETNKNFFLKKIKKNKFFDTVLNNFGINKNYSIYIVNKQSKTSRIYFVKKKNKTFVLRSSTIKQSKYLESQCRLVSGIKGNLYFKVLKGKSGYTFELNNLNFFLYRKVEGKIFNGKIIHLDYIFNSILILHRSLKKKNILKSNLEIKKYKINEIKKNTNLLTNKRFLNQMFLKKILGQQSKKLIFRNKIYLRNCINKISKINLKEKNLQIVHGDLNHSNIMIRNKRVTFLDLEDLVVDNFKIALSTGIFKILRHVLYKNKNKLGYVSKYCLNLCKYFIKKNYFNNHNEVINFCVFRILSDISFIINSFNLGEKKYLYDFEKKILNLIELRYIFKLHELKS